MAHSMIPCLFAVEATDSRLSCRCKFDLLEKQAVSHREPLCVSEQ